MILIDYSQVSLANILAFKKDLASGDSKTITNLIRHATLSTIKSYKKKYGKEYGELVICCDGRKYWRREFFEQYKINRKKNREASDLDWHIIFDTLAKIRDEMIEHFPYRVIHLEECEADDIIAILTKHENSFGGVLQNEDNIFSDKPIMIVSSDGDFKQLHKWRNVKQYSPILHKMVTVKHSEIKPNLIEHIVKGDSGDGVPNILSRDEIFTVQERQTPVSSKRLAEFIENGFDACRNDTERKNWHRNQTLVDFEFIPKRIQNLIVETFINTKPKGDKMSIMNYLITNKCRLLLDEIEGF